MDASANVLTNAYKSESEQLFRDVCGREHHAMCNGFMLRWSKHHAQIIELFEREPNTTNTEKWSVASKEFLALRNRLVSALAQGLQNEINGQQWMNKMRLFIAAHDEVFIRFLSTQQEVLKKELNDAQNMRTAIGAYARSARQMGDSKLW
jgi:hypothetical protein